MNDRMHIVDFGSGDSKSVLKNWRETSGEERQNELDEAQNRRWLGASEIQGNLAGGLMRFTRSRFRGLDIQVTCLDTISCIPSPVSVELDGVLLSLQNDMNPIGDIDAMFALNPSPAIYCDPRSKFAHPRYIQDLTALVRTRLCPGGRLFVQLDNYYNRGGRQERFLEDIQAMECLERVDEDFSYESIQYVPHMSQVYRKV